MAKLHTLVSPFGELTLRVLSDHVSIAAASPLAGDWGLGWWHAHHSGDEAAFARSFWRAELSAGPRPTPAQIEIDAFIGPWRFAADLSLETSRLPAGQRSRVQAYAQGFNHGRPRGPRETPWTPEDCHLLARTLGFLEWWEVRLPQKEFLLESWRAGLSWAKMVDLWPGLGPEPGSSSIGPGEEPPRFPAFSPEARQLIDKVRRFRPSPAWVVPGTHTAHGHALLGAAFISDVTDPGLPLMAAAIECGLTTVRGLSLPGHPGFLAGRTDKLAWHAAPAIDDTIDLRGNQGVHPAGLWAGSGKTGTLAGLLALEEASTVEQAHRQTIALGSACLDLAAIDSTGEAARWAQGPRWERPVREAWFPSFTGEAPFVGSRTLEAATEREWASRVTLANLEEHLIEPRSSFSEFALAPLRFLLPDTERGQKLRRWAGTPGPERLDFERLYGAVLEEFWYGSPVSPEVLSPVAQSLATRIDGLIQAPHSAWFPSQQKNHRLAEAVRRAFTPGRPLGPAVLGRRAPLACWSEVHGTRPRVFAATTVMLVDLGASDWRVFLTDDESEAPVFHRW